MCHNLSFSLRPRALRVCEYEYYTNPVSRNTPSYSLAVESFGVAPSHTCADRLKALRVTMNELPDDILKDVFLWTLPNTGEIRESPSSRAVGHLVPLRISHVCRRWRNISLMVSSLWSYLSFDYSYSYHSKERGDRLLELYDTWLQRTRNSPLNFYVSLHFTDWDDPEGRSLPQRIVSSLLFHQRRWMDIDFTWNFNLPTDLSELEISISDMPMLVSATFKLRVKSHLGEPVEPQLNIARSPLLQDLCLTGIYSLDFGERPIYTLRRVRLFNERWTYEDAREACLKLLSVAPNLKELSVTCVNEGRSGPDSSSTDALVHDIESLTIADSFATYLLPKLMLPSLQYLDYEVGWGYEISALLEFIQRSSPPLKSLTLDTFDFLQNKLVPLLRSLPTLQTLRINPVRDATWLLRELTFGIDGRKTCPELHSLDIDGLFIRDKDESLDALCAMLIPRFGGCAKISVTWRREVDVPRQCTPEFYDWLCQQLDHKFANRVVVCKSIESLRLLLE